MAGIDMITEGAVVLNQINNILDESPELFVHNTPAERLCAMLMEADVVTFIIGRSINDAHNELVFKQLGILPAIQPSGLFRKSLKARASSWLRNTFELLKKCLMLKKPRRVSGAHDGNKVISVLSGDMRIGKDSYQAVAAEQPSCKLLVDKARKALSTG